MMELIKELLVSRLAQLAGRGVGIVALALVTKFHGDPSTVAGMPAETVTIAAAVIGFVFDLVVHGIQHGGVLNHHEDEVVK